MKKTFIAILCFQICLIGSCKKPPQESPPIEPKPITYHGKLEVLWEALFHSDTTPDFFWDFEVADNQYLVLANIYDRAYGKPRGIGVYNMQTGERHPAWQNDPGGIFGISEREELADCKVAGKNKDIILIYNYFELFAYNLHTGQRMWKLNIQNLGGVGIPKMSAQGDYAFISYGPGGALSKSWYRLVMVDVYSGQKREVLQLEIEDNYEFEINPPSAYVMNNGDTLLFFTTSALNFETLDGRAYTYCYNLTKKEMIWINKPLTTDRNMSASASKHPPFIAENDKLIVTGRKMIWCLNQHTGEMIWERDELFTTGCNPLYHEGKLYIRANNPCILLCLDVQTGQTVWQNTTLNPYPAFDGAMAIYKDRLYFSVSGNNATYHLACIDIYTGQELWRDRGPYGNGFAFGVLIDQKTGYLYCNTGWSVMCVDLNKTPK